jgi:hypothetical protein
MRRFLLLVFAFIAPAFLLSRPPRNHQSYIVIQFNQGKKPLNIGDTIYMEGGRFVVSSLKFYLGSLNSIGKQGLKTKMLPSERLIDLAQNNNHEIPVLIPRRGKTDSIEIGIGIDSAAHRTVAFTNDLDPVNSMYWAWQSGFIQLKLEGQWIQRVNNAVPVEWHLGGYRWPNSTARTIRYPAAIHGLKGTLLAIDILPLLEGGLKKYSNKIMSPGEPAAKLMDVFARSCIQIYPGKSK